ncbi:MAG: GntR family transcriptional regulator [Rhodobacteraceae bacterium]|nr:GntR family transcriptional regulator [Paracoccaceae bacterium]
MLEEDIAQRTLRPGDRLDETRLARRFNVSRTPVREALLSLESSGLVESRPHKGRFVRQFGALELMKMYETMAEFEASCARLACGSMTDEHKKNLEDALAACGQAADANDAEVYSLHNESFHQALSDAAENPFLGEYVRHLQQRLRPFRRHQLRAPNRLTTSYQEHCEVVAAIKNRDPRAAEEAVRAHVGMQSESEASNILKD